MSRIKIIFLVSLGVFTLSFAAILIRLTEAPSIVIAAGRLLVASLILQPLFFKNFSKYYQELKQTQWWLVVLAGLFLALHFALWIESLNHTSVPSSVVLVTTDPIFVALLSPLLLGEKVSFKIIMGIILGMAGVFLISQASFSSFSKTQGNILALMAAFCTACYLIIGRKVRQQLSLVSYIYLMYTTSAVVLIVIMFLMGKSFLGLAPKAYIFIVLLGLGPQLIGHTSFNWALRYLQTPVVAMLILGEPIGSMILSWLILKEPPILPEIIGGAIIFLSIYIAASDSKILQ
ncbi:MAG: DMT family transporter [candidate division WOR-3 bacterium]|nr:DMT family transporter [candidate division WOR-3 bacterium]MDW7987347.1 DMT family transporter [candidate division WOR-3 bacterium]